MAFRVLTQVNYSSGENPEGDSGLHFTVGLLQSLVRLDANFHFYVLVPKRHEAFWAASLSNPRITLVPLELQPRLHGGDFQFCPLRLSESFDFRRFDVDALFLNQPETAPALLQFFNRQTFHNVPAVSYVHWFDTRRPSTPKETLHHPALLGTLAGLMVSAFVGCNSAYGRDQILTYAARWFRGDAINDLSRRIRLLPPGVDTADLEQAKFTPSRLRPCRILVNHRLLKYTGVRTLLTEGLPALWERRQDFSVVVTNPTRVRLPGTITQVPWLTTKTLSRSDYLRQLWDSDIVVAPHRACHWSMSTLEAICAGCVPLMNRESFFPEMMEPLLAELSAGERKHIDSRWYYFRGSFISRLSGLLNNLAEERCIAQRVASHCTPYVWLVQLGRSVAPSLL